MRSLCCLAILWCGIFWCGAVASAQNKPYRLPSVDLKQRVIWGSECIVNDNLGLAFGGQDQQAGGAPQTQVRREGKWKPLSEVAPFDDSCPVGSTPWFTESARADTSRYAAEVRRWYLSDLADDLFRLRNWPQVSHRALELEMNRNILLERFGGASEIVEHVLPKQSFSDQIDLEGKKALTASFVKAVVQEELSWRQVDDLVQNVPVGRALSSLVYDEKTGLFVLFGGDHLDFLLNDTWVFDPQKLEWESRHPKSAPLPRANHKLTAKGDGTIKLSGGYTYANNYDYMGGQYVDLDDGDWTYEIAKNEWSGGKGVSPLKRTYRTGKFHPDYFLQEPRPNRAAHEKVLADLPANTWVSLQPPHLPEMNRDWGTAVLDPDRELILRFSGGHCAHSGSDVLHYHIATNRWELPFPVEFPLGQCYTNTEYPEGANFNGRPWVTGHTYQNYGYDPLLKKMLFTGRERGCFVWDCDRADWSGRIEKPSGMSYNSCFYTLTLTPTPAGLVCWTNEGRIFQFEAKTNAWVERELTGEKLPGAVVDHSTILYDSKRNRLLAVVKSYGEKAFFSGELHAIACEDWSVSKISPSNAAAAEAVPYLCQLRYDAANDLVLVGGTLPPNAEGL